jgi:hypothetical protein
MPLAKLYTYDNRLPARVLIWTLAFLAIFCAIPQLLLVSQSPLI